MADEHNNFDEKNDQGRPEFHDHFLDGNEVIEEAIAKYYENNCQETFSGILDALRNRMHEDGHFMIPVETMPDGSFALRSITLDDGKQWQVAFTSPAEYEKGEQSDIISHFISAMFNGCLTSKSPGIVINPWGQGFAMTRELMDILIKADGGVEYSVPDEDITPELLEDGSFLTRVVEICNRNGTQLNMIKLLRYLRDSWVWVPGNAIFSMQDKKNIDEIVLTAQENDALDSMVGKNFTTNDPVRFVPDILQNGDDYYFPIFTTVDAMGEYGEQFSKVQKHIFECLSMAENNEKDVKGIVINAFSTPVTFSMDMLDILKDMDSNFPTESDS